jgi:hypothetical protein
VIAGIFGKSEERCYLARIGDGMNTYRILGAGGSVVVNALCYKSEGRGFDTQ